MAVEKRVTFDAAGQPRITITIDGWHDAFRFARKLRAQAARVDRREIMEVAGRCANSPRRGRFLSGGTDMAKRTPEIKFTAYVARTTDCDVLSDSLGEFATLDAAEAAIQRRADKWDGATIYEIEVTYGRDDLGPYPIEHELRTRNYVLAADLRTFECDEIVDA